MIVLMRERDSNSTSGPWTLATALTGLSQGGANSRWEGWHMLLTYANGLTGRYFRITAWSYSNQYLNIRYFQAWTPIGSTVPPYSNV